MKLMGKFKNSGAQTNRHGSGAKLKPNQTISTIKMEDHRETAGYKSKLAHVYWDI